MKDFFKQFAISFFAGLLAIVSAAAGAYYLLFLPWWRRPLGPPLDIHTLQAVTSQQYMWLWIPFAMVATIATVGLWRVDGGIRAFVRAFTDWAAAGTAKEIRSLFAQAASDTGKEWRNKPLILVVYHGQTVNVAEARAQGYSGICAYLGQGDEKPDRAWVRGLSAQAKGVMPLFIMWGIVPAYEGYSQGQRTAEPQVNALLWQLDNIEYSGVVMNVENPYKWQTQVIATPSNIGAATKAFYDTVVNLTGKPVIVRSTDSFVQKYTVDGSQRFMSWIQTKPYWIAERKYRIVAGTTTTWYEYLSGAVSATLEQLRERVYAPDVDHCPPDESLNPLVPENAVKKFWEFSRGRHIPTGIVFDAYGKPSKAAVVLSFAPDEDYLWSEYGFAEAGPTEPGDNPDDPPIPPAPDDPGLAQIMADVTEIKAILQAHFKVL